MSALTIGGITSRLLLEKTLWNSVLAIRIKIGHKLFGYLVILLSQVTLLLGGIAYSERRPLAKTLVIFEVIIFTLLVTIFEIRFQIYRN